ncbi:MAG: winged helix-turn-helix domain-containing protein [Halapricum sp.]
MPAQLEVPPSNSPPERPESAEIETVELLDLLGDEYTRRVFEAIAERPRTGRAVAEAADISRPTAYRRLNDLCDAGLARAEIEICEDGHHRERYVPLAESLSVSLDDGIEAMVKLAE